MKQTYDRDDLLVVAEIAHQYLFSGDTALALVLFEGLTVVAPKDSYFALALGVTHDQRGDERLAHHWYGRASKLDPADGRADVNRGELFLGSGDVARARVCFSRGFAKARASGDVALEKKARAVLDFVGPSADSPRSVPPRRARRIRSGPALALVPSTTRNGAHQL